MLSSGATLSSSSFTPAMTLLTTPSSASTQTATYTVYCLSTTPRLLGRSDSTANQVNPSWGTVRSFIWIKSHCARRLPYSSSASCLSLSLVTFLPPPQPSSWGHIFWYSTVGALCALMVEWCRAYSSTLPCPHHRLCTWHPCHLAALHPVMPWRGYSA